MNKILIKNGLIVDGSGEKGYYSNLLIENGLIKTIGEGIDDKDCVVIDATNMVVSPGFIDMHSHSDMGIFTEPSAYNVLGQGITTQITGQCATGIVPFCEESLSRENFIPKEKWEFYKEKCDTFTAFVNHVNSLKMATNYAMYIPHGAVRERVMGFSDSVPNEVQMNQMKDYFREGMRCGLLGYSSGLVYPPSCYAKTEELIELAKIVGEYNGTYVSHIRNEGDYVEDSVKEAIEIGEKANVRVNISHLKIEGSHNKGKSYKLLGLIEDANKNGHYVRADQYPYDGGCAPLILQVPPKYITEGIDNLIENLKDDEFRKKIDYSIFNESYESDSALYTAGYEGTMISSALNCPEVVGKTIAEIAQEKGVTPIDAMCDVILKANGDVDAIYLSQNMDDILNIMGSPYVAAGTDGSDHQKEYSPSTQGGDHPRAIGAMPMRLRLIRDNEIMPLERAIYQMTAMAAEMAGVANVGLIKENYKADICIFDYNNIKERANYMYPYRPNEGIKYVLVGGMVAFKDGKVTGEKNGVFLKLSRD